MATDPATLEVELINRERYLRKQRDSFDQLLPTLIALHNNDSTAFIIRTYEGRAGLKQMCWHELKTKGELLGLGNGTIEDIVTDDNWANEHRSRQISVGYSVREVVNYAYGADDVKAVLASSRLYEAGLYLARLLPPEVLRFDNQTVIYNDTVSIYHWKHDKKVGVEIISQSYADMMRQLFEHYWRLAVPLDE